MNKFFISSILFTAAYAGVDYDSQEVIEVCKNKDQSTMQCVESCPKAIVFDFGGVLNGSPDRESIVAFLCDTFDLSKEEFKKVNQEKRQAIKAGKTILEFWYEYAEKQNMTLPKNWMQQFQAVLKESINVNSDMYALIDHLKEKQLQVGLLSNIETRVAKLIHSFDLYQPFEPCLLSCEIGYDKPDPRAYEILLNKIDLPAEQIVFIDDRIENIEAAQKLGIDAILFTSHAQIEKELRARGAI